MLSAERHAIEAAIRGDLRLWHYWHMRSVTATPAIICHQMAAKQIRYYAETGRKPTPADLSDKAEIRLYNRHNRNRKK